jgi:hypothetical protein
MMAAEASQRGWLACRATRSRHLPPRQLRSPGMFPYCYQTPAIPTPRQPETPETVRMSIARGESRRVIESSATDAQRFIVLLSVGDVPELATSRP